METIYVITLFYGSVIDIINCGTDSEKAESEFISAIRKLRDVSDDDMNNYLDEGRYNVLMNDIQIFHQID